VGIRKKDGTGGILSGKRVYDTYYDGGKSRQNSTPKKNKVVKNEFLYGKGCG
jgi:hypothetical protein